jgi:GT2 family glycosyltransferase
MNMTVDVVILSLCRTKEDFRVNKRCLESLLHSENDIAFRVIIVESNADFPKLGLSYDQSNVTLIIPHEPFRFNRFLNIGLERTRHEWLVFSNNDVIFHNGWFSEILKVKEVNSRIRSFCPFDRTSPYLTYDKFRHRTYQIGYRMPIEFVGWCFVVERSVFDEVGKFDERYDLYFGDNDFARTLRRHSILHALVPSSSVEHLGGYTTKTYDASNTPA